MCTNEQYVSRNSDGAMHFNNIDYDWGNEYFIFTVSFQKMNTVPINKKVMNIN